MKAAKKKTRQRCGLYDGVYLLSNRFSSISHPKEQVFAGWFGFGYCSAEY